MSTNIITDKNRINYIDVARGIGIILVVLTHAGIDKLNIIDYFQMPLFIFLSGYTFNVSNSFKIILKKKIKRLYIPFVVASFTFLIFHNLLYKIHFYSSFYTLNNYLIKSLKILSFDMAEKLLAPAWFLFTLFFITILFKIIYDLFDKILCKNNFLNANNNLIFIFYLILAIVGIFLTNKEITFVYSNCYAINVILTSAIFFYIGWYLKNTNINLKKVNKYLPMLVLILSFIIIVIAKLKFRYTADFRVNYFSNYYLFLPTALAGIYVIIVISKFIQKYGNLFKKVLTYLGQNTIIIFLLHLTSFKIIGLIQVYYFNYPISKLPDFKNVYTGGIWGYLYLLVGLIVPILCQIIINSLRWSGFFRQAGADYKC
jgi:fucose 4-O-acetylase-like acetyltransferase